MTDSLVVEVTDWPENLQVSDLEHICISKGGGIYHLDEMVVGAGRSAEGDSRVKLHLEGSSMHNRGVGSVNIVTLVRILDVVIARFGIATGVGGVTDGKAGEIVDD